MSYAPPMENYAKRTQGGMTPTGAQNGPYASPPFVPVRPPGAPAPPPAAGYQQTTAPPPPAAPAQGPVPAPPATPYSNQNQIQTNITPQSIYTPGMTSQAVNQAVADNTPDIRSAMKQFDRPGVSRSAGTMAAALPTVAASALAQRQAASQIPLLDDEANQKMLLDGEVARENQALQMGNLLNQLNQTRQQQQVAGRQQGLQSLQQNSSLLNALMGMV